MDVEIASISAYLLNFTELRFNTNECVHQVIKLSECETNKALYPAHNVTQVHQGQAGTPVAYRVLGHFIVCHSLLNCS